MNAFFVFSLATLACIYSITAESGTIVFDIGQRFKGCGGDFDESKDLGAALAGDPQCDKCVTVKGPNGAQVKIPIKDKCGDCDGKKIKLSSVAYEQIGGNPKNPNTREINGEWNIGGC